jgi:uncharacterized protein (DUF983 family)
MSAWNGRRLRAVLQQRCPACLQGQVFRSTFQFLPACQLCGHRFEREPGFFQGAIYASYTIGILVFLAVTTAAYKVLLPDAGLKFALLVAALVYLLTMPSIYRYCCIILAHLTIGAPGQKR